MFQIRQVIRFSKATCHFYAPFLLQLDKNEKNMMIFIYTENKSYICV